MTPTSLPVLGSDDRIYMVNAKEMAKLDKLFEKRRSSACGYIGQRLTDSPFGETYVQITPGSEAHRLLLKGG